MHREVRRRDDQRLPAIAMAALAVLALAGILVAGRRIGFFFDEWDFVQGRRGWNPDVFLDPHNEHISVLPVAAFKLLFELVGLEPHWPYRVLVALLNVGCGVVVFLLARQRVGGWGALVAAALFLVMGRAAENFLWAFQTGFVGSVLLGLLALLALDRADTRGDVLASIALVGAALCSSLGVPIAVGVGVELLAGGRRRALWIPAAPLAVYGLWYLGWGAGTSSMSRDSVVKAATWAADAAAAASGAVAGLSIDWGRGILVVLVVVIVTLVARGHPLTARAAGLIATVVVFWGLTGASRSLLVEATTSRYLTLGGAVLILLAVELARDLRLERWWAWAGAGLVAFSFLASLPFVRDHGNSLRSATGLVEAELGALQLAGAAAPAGYRPDPRLAPQITAGEFLAAAADSGDSPGDDPEELRKAFNAERVQADRVLQDVAVRARPAADRRAGRACRRVSAGQPLELAVPARGLILRSDRPQRAALRLRRFGDDFDNPPSPLDVRREGVVIGLAADRSPVPYQAQIAAASGSVTVCVV